MLDLITTAMVLVTLGAYIWSARSHFRSDQLEAGARLIAVMVFATAAIVAWLIWSRDQPAMVQMAGFVVQVVAFALFWAAIRETRRARLLAAFTASNPESLVTTGPYRYVRHPFYTSYILFWFGSALATGVWWTLILAGAMFAIYLRAAKEEEARFAQTPMAEQYAAFKNGRARFFPGLF